MNEVDTKTKLVEVLRTFDDLMVATLGDNGTMHARPMAVAEIDPDGCVWFATMDSSEKTDEVEVDARALVTGQSKGAYVSVSGHVDVVHDRARIEALWKESWKAWFPEGKDDPDLVLLRFQPEIGEYWDQRGAKGVRFLFEAARAIVQGDRAKPTGSDQHAKVPM
jgi:general stress protein 26